MPLRSGAPAALLLASLALLALPAGAQVQDVAPTWPGGLALPVLGAAGAEEATALSVNPAGLGLVGSPALHYQHEQSTQAGGGSGDGLYAAGPLGFLSPGLAVEWVRPAQFAGPAYRLTTFGLALSDGRVASLGVAWRWWSSSDAALEALHAWDLGLTLRPARWLSLGASAQGLDARLDGVRLPARYDLGLATRLAGDRLTLSADLLADNNGNPYRAVQAAAGAQLEVQSGLVLSAQLRVPLPDATGSERGLATLLALGWNAPHAGVTFGGSTHDGDARLLAGLRVSRERYRGAPLTSEVPRLELAGLLEPRRFLFLTLTDRDPYGALLERLDQARQDPGVAAVVLEVGELPLGAARIEELRAVVARLRAAKPVLAYLVGGGTREYWLASAATAVAAPPGASLVVNGLVRNQIYLKDGLARLGVTVEVARAGAYKAAPEPLTRGGPSDESRVMTASLLDDVAGRLRTDLAASRHLAPERVAALLDQGLFTGEEAKAAGLVDELLWPDELEGWARRRTGRATVGLSPGWRQAPARRAQHWGAPPAIAVVRLEGTIVSGRSRGEPLGDGGLAGAETVAAALREAADDARVRAIVLRIESPGGDAHASDLIWREVVRAKARKPLVVSMGDLAASGGYLVAVGADLIVAEPSTLTGSIGVFALKPDLSGVLQKLSLGHDVQQRGQNADVASLVKPWTAAERAAVERLIDAIYRGFLEKVAAGRKLPLAEVEALAGGRVWTGAQALERRLVDRLGGLAEALALARQQGGLQADEPVELLWRGGRERFDLSNPMASLSALVLEGAPQQPLVRAAAALPGLRSAAILLELGPVVALPVEWLGSEVP